MPDYGLQSRIFLLLLCRLQISRRLFLGISVLFQTCLAVWRTYRNQVLWRKPLHPHDQLRSQSRRVVGAPATIMLLCSTPTCHVFVWARGTLLCRTDGFLAVMSRSDLSPLHGILDNPSKPSHSQSPSRSLSKISRRRALASPLSRSMATPGHASQMQKIFQDAKSSLKLDAAIGSSSTGSIALRSPGRPSDTYPANVYTTAEFRDTHERYSIALSGGACIGLEVREPLATISPRLPDHDFPGGSQTPQIAREPPNSGFASPVTLERFKAVGEDDSPLTPLSTPSSHHSR